MIKKGFAILALSSLLLASLPALADAVSALNLPACCNTVYCPMHHRQSENRPQGKGICSMPGHSTQDDCSMHACDMSASPAVGSVLFVLAAPVAISRQANVEPAPIRNSGFVPFHLNLPSTPPPRTVPS